MGVVIEIIHTVRRVRAEYGLVRQKPSMCLRGSNQAMSDYLNDYASTIVFLSQSHENLRILKEGEAPTGESNVTVIVPGAGVEVFVDMEGMIDFEKEIANLEKKITNLKKTVQSLEKKRSEKTYSVKVPEAIQLDDANKLESALDEMTKAEVAVKNMQVMLSKRK
jgi:valyl-tRNA synthetase